MFGSSLSLCHAYTNILVSCMQVIDYLKSLNEFNEDITMLIFSEPKSLEETFRTLLEKITENKLSFTLNEDL